MQRESGSRKLFGDACLLTHDQRGTPVESKWKRLREGKTHRGKKRLVEFKINYEWGIHGSLGKSQFLEGCR